MGIKDTLMNSLGFQDQNEEEYQYEDDYAYEEQDYVEEQPAKQQKAFSGLGFRSSASETTSDDSHTGSGMRIVLLQPSRFEEAQNIASYLLDNKVVVFDLQECDVDTAINIVNFVSGAIYASTAPSRRSTTAAPFLWLYRQAFRWTTSCASVLARTITA